VTRTEALMRADQVVAAVLSREAGQIANTRERLDSESDWLGDMSLVTMATGLIPYVGKAAQVAAEVAMVAKAVGESTDQFMSMRDQADENAAEVRDALEQYEAIAGAAGDVEADADAEEFEPTSTGEPVSDEHARGSADRPVAPPSGGGGVAAGAEGGGVPAGGAAPGPGAAPSSPVPSPVSAPLSPPSGPTAAPQPAAAGDIAGVLGSVMGAMLGPLGGIVGGVVQAAGQAVQAATQAGAQAAQLAGQAPGTAEPEAVDEIEKSGRDVEDRETDDDEGKDDDAEQREQDGAGAPPAGDDDPNRRPEAGADTDSAGEDDKKAAMTLPPDLAAASALGTGTGPAPVHIGADFEHSQLRMPAAATLDAGVPGSAAASGT
jgi:hypothetical protein